MKEGISIFANLEDIKRRVHTIRSEIRRMEEDDKKAPDGELVCARNGKNYNMSCWSTALCSRQQS